MTTDTERAAIMDRITEHAIAAAAAWRDCNLTLLQIRLEYIETLGKQLNQENG